MDKRGPLVGTMGHKIVIELLNVVLYLTIEVCWKTYSTVLTVTHDPDSGLWFNYRPRTVNR